MYVEMMVTYKYVEMMVTYKCVEMIVTFTSKNLECKSV